MALAVEQELINLQFMIDLAKCGISEVFSEVITGTESVGIVKGEVDRSLPGLFFFF